MTLNLASMGELPHNWPFIYFHGEVEGVVSQNKSTEEAPDLVSADVSLAEVEDGEQVVFVYGRQAVLFLWTNGTRNMVTGLVQPQPTKEQIQAAKDAGEDVGALIYTTRPEPNRRGLIVFKVSEADESDPHSDYGFAKRKFEERAEHL